MALFIGVGLGAVIGLLTSVVGMDRDRALYPAMLIVIASYYVLFAIMGDSAALVWELAIAAVFLLAALVGFRTNLWIVAFSVAGHGVQDLFHGQLVENAGVPTWWPMFCASIDVVLGAYLAWRLHAKKIPASYPRMRAQAEEA